MLSSQQNLRELKLPMPSLLVNHTQSQVLKTAACSKRMIVIYKKGSSFEIGRIKRLTDTGAFVYYSRGETAAKTPYDHLFKLDNAGCIDGMQLGGYADQDDPPFQFDMKEDNPNETL